MENNKDIGKAIREKLRDFDQSPHDKLWLKIEADLGKKKKRRILPFWVLFALLLAPGIGWIYQNSSSNATLDRQENVPGQAVSAAADRERAQKNKSDQSSAGKTLDEKPLVDEKSLAGKSPAERSAVVNDAKHPSDKNSAEVPQKSMGKMAGKGAKSRGTSLAKNRKPNLKDKPDQVKSSKPRPVWNQTDGIVKIPGLSPSNERKTSSGIAAKIDDGTSKNKIPGTGHWPISPEEKPSDLAKTESLQTAKKKKTDKKTDLPAAIEKIAQKLDLFVYAAPAYVGNFSKGSTLDRRLNDNKKTSEIRFGYGLYGIYETDDRWSLRFGLALVNLRYITENATVNTTDYSYIAYSEISNAMIYEQSGDTTMDIIQDVSCLEIPLGFKYVLRPAKFGVNVYGGISYTLLTKNEVSAKTASGMRFELGETGTLNDNSFTFNAGIGFDYKLSKQIRFNLEPVFKLHLFDYKNLDARPYSIGVLAGLQFSLK